MSEAELAKALYQELVEHHEGVRIPQVRTDHEHKRIKAHKKQEARNKAYGRRSRDHRSTRA